MFPKGTVGLNFGEFRRQLSPACWHAGPEMHRRECPEWAPRSGPTRRYRQSCAIKHAVGIDCSGNTLQVVWPYEPCLEHAIGLAYSGSWGHPFFLRSIFDVLIIQLATKDSTMVALPTRYARSERRW